MERTTQSPKLQIETLVKQLTAISEKEATSTIANDSERIQILRSIRQLLLDYASTTEAQDVFRRAGGFEALVLSLDELSNVTGGLAVPQDSLNNPVESLRATLEVVSAAITEHSGNSQYFSSRPGHNGWIALERACFALFDQSAAQEATADSITETREHLLGVLLGTALVDETVISLFRQSRRQQDVSSLKENDEPTAQHVKDFAAHSLDIEAIEDQVKNKIGPRPILSIPAIIPVLFNIWRHWYLRDTLLPEHLSCSVLLSIKTVITAREYNNVALYRTGILSLLLESILDDEFPDNIQLLLKNLAREQAKLGLKSLGDVSKIFNHASHSEEVSEFLLDLIKASMEPSHIHFDLSIQGYAALELTQLKQSFPPSEPSTGYTVMTWLRVDELDGACHTTLFGLLDTTQTCFVLVYIERDSRHLVLQTSVTSGRPSVRFKSFKFEIGIWYHLTITHLRTHGGESSRVSLYLNGEFREHVRCAYPRTAAASTIQAFFGTPRDLSPRLGTNVLCCRWSMASAWLFSEALVPELILVYQKLGPSYQGSFQDCLGSFQTYRASALLNMYNETLHPNKNEESVIIKAIRSAAGKLNPEHNVLIAVSGSNVIYSNDAHRQMANSSSSGALSTSNAVIPNGAFPQIPDALNKSAGVAVLTSGCIACETYPISSGSWRLSGCVISCLKLIEAASSAQALFNSVKILFALIKDDWRNSDAMEREDGFGILAWLLRTKLAAQHDTNPRRVVTLPSIVESEEQIDLLKRDLLLAILAFVGFEHHEPRKSMIVNPLAYRILLVDCDIWRKADLSTQSIYYDQFVVFGCTSTHREFNTKRLDRMRAIKKLIDALKGESIRRTAVSILVEALRTLLQSTMSADILRSMALFITYSLHPEPAPSYDTAPLSHGPRNVAQKTEPSTKRPPTKPKPTVATEFTDDPQLSRQELGINVLEMFTDILTGNSSDVFIKRFAKTVTNKWLLHLFAVDDKRVVIAAARILARLLAISGPSYRTRFQDTTKGFLVLRTRLRHWWRLGDLWMCCFAMFLGLDVASLNWNGLFNATSLIDLLEDQRETCLICPSAFSVLVDMLEEGMYAAAESESSTSSRSDTPATGASVIHSSKYGHEEDYQGSILRSVIEFLQRLHEQWEPFLKFSLSSNLVKDMLKILLAAQGKPRQTDVTASELGMGEQATDAASHPSSMAEEHAPTLAQSSTESMPLSRRKSSYVVVGSLDISQTRATAFHHPLEPSEHVVNLTQAASLVEEKLLQLVVRIVHTQLFQQKDFPGLGLFLKVPPGSLASRSYLTCRVTSAVVSDLSVKVDTESNLFWEPRNLSNISRFATQICEAVFEGWLRGLLSQFLRFLASLLQYLQKPDVRSIKSVRLCSPTISIVQQVFRRLVLLGMASTTDSSQMESSNIMFLGELVSWQDVLLLPDEMESNWLPSFCYLLLRKLLHGTGSSRHAAGDLWRVIAEHKLADIEGIIYDAARGRLRAVGVDFCAKLKSGSTESLLSWVSEHSESLSTIFSSLPESLFARIVVLQNEASEQSAKARVSKREERLQRVHLDELAVRHAWTEHDINSKRWSENIYFSERFKYRRARQDQQENLVYLESAFNKQRKLLRSLNVSDDDLSLTKWQLDEAEGRDRMRLRLSPMADHDPITYRPKRAPTIREIQRQDENSVTTPSTPGRSRATSSASTKQGLATPIEPNLEAGSGKSDVTGMYPAGGEDEFEFVPDPQAETDELDDKNRKVMRSLQRGEHVDDVYNVSRIRGLEACPCLLIVGRSCIYFLDNLFQRQDGEVVNVDRVPKEERDPYTEALSGLGSALMDSSFKKELETRHWTWGEVISISKRHFLLRDVAIEIFFEDGYSYLLTTATPQQRNAIHDSLTERAQKAQSGKSVEDGAWRVSLLRNPKDSSQTIGSKFANVFASMSVIPATKRWIKREISTFQYLMIINTLAGRTFNDLTQYPVFPWVLADYSSEELDLDDPRTFRDLSKPMGCQTPQREIAFRERYKSFAEMSDERTPPFHYGTHYSSAMIVTSFLIRLQPYVQSYLLLQGGKFDLADRLFSSVEKAWLSASRETMTDVRELTPEFFYLPGFLVNHNRYDFGAKEGTGEVVNDVVLPPWAKGDPEMFISKHREALESSYVRQNLHQWIDLIFGCKQRGEAALEATNVFHHLSYSGSRDLDSIQDDLERRATIGIIHNFGQTPRQVFTRPHERSEVGSSNEKDVSAIMETLRMSTTPVQDMHKPVYGLFFQQKSQKLLCCERNQTCVRPDFNVLIEWDNSDKGVRFYISERRKLLGLFEQLHSGQISAVHVVDSTTLLTASLDGTVIVWTMQVDLGSVEIHARGTLFGHREAVTLLSASRSFSTAVTGSVDGTVFVWDLIRLSVLHRIRCPGPIECMQTNDKTGHILLCTRRRVLVFTLNGRQLINQEVCRNDDCISACAFFETWDPDSNSSDKWDASEVFFTGHRQGVVNVWRVTTSPKGTWMAELLRTLDHIDRAGRNFAAPITCISAAGRRVNTADSAGRVFEWYYR